MNIYKLIVQGELGILGIALFVSESFVLGWLVMMCLISTIKIEPTKSELEGRLKE